MYKKIMQMELAMPTFHVVVKALRVQATVNRDQIAAAMYIDMVEHPDYLEWLEQERERNPAGAEYRRALNVLERSFDIPSYIKEV